MWQRIDVHVVSRKPKDDVLLVDHFRGLDPLQADALGALLPGHRFVCMSRNRNAGDRQRRIRFMARPPAVGRNDRFDIAVRSKFSARECLNISLHVSLEQSSMIPASSIPVRLTVEADDD